MKQDDGQWAMGTAATKSCIKDTKNGKRDLTLGGWNSWEVGF